MTSEQMILAVAAIAVSCLLTLVAYSGSRMDKSIDDIKNTIIQIKDSISSELREISSALMSIEKDIRLDLQKHDFTLQDHDKRLSDTETKIDVIIERRKNEGRRETNGKH